MGMEEIDVQAYLRIFPKSNPPLGVGMENHINSKKWNIIIEEEHMM